MTVASPLPPPGQPLKHYVSPEPFDPMSIEAMTTAQERVYLASQWRLMWWKFSRHRVAAFAAGFLAVMLCRRSSSASFSRPTICTPATSISSTPRRSRCISSIEGEFVGPFVYGRTMRLNMDNLKREYTDNPTTCSRSGSSAAATNTASGACSRATFTSSARRRTASCFLLGTDRLGRDLLSRIIYGARISLTIGLFGVTVSFILGIVIGGIAGYHGGIFDLFVQRIIEVLQSLPSIPLWLALAAIMPVTWSPILVYFGITLILGCSTGRGWRARCARSCWRSARRTMCSPPSSWAPAPAASSAAIWFRASCPISSPPPRSRSRA